MFREKELIARFTKEISFFIHEEMICLDNLDEDLSMHEEIQKNTVSAMKQIRNIAIRFKCDRKVIKSMNDDIKFFEEWVSRY